MDDFKWINESQAEFSKDLIKIYAPAGSEYFANPLPIDGSLSAPITTAPILYKEVKGDFVMKVLLEVDFVNPFDAACLMVFGDENHYAKACFEQSDSGAHSIVTAVTRGVADDCTGVSINGNSVWMQVARVGNCLGIHYSLDGENFEMARLFELPMGETVKVGLEAQCPSGDGGYRYYRNLNLESRTLTDLRAGL